MTHDDRLFLCLLAIGAQLVGSFMSFLYAQDENIGPRGDFVPFEVTVVWRVLWSVLWPLRFVRYVAYALFVSARACLTFARWSIGRGIHLPKARLVK